MNIVEKSREYIYRIATPEDIEKIYPIEALTEDNGLRVSGIIVSLSATYEPKTDSDTELLMFIRKIMRMRSVKINYAYVPTEDGSMHKVCVKDQILFANSISNVKIVHGSFEIIDALYHRGKNVEPAEVEEYYCDVGGRGECADQG